MRKFKSSLNLFLLRFRLKCFKLRIKQQSVFEIYKVAKKYFNYPITFWQIEDEICSFIYFVKEKKPDTFLEIGTAGGGSLFMISQVISPNGLLISIDLPSGDYGGGYPESRIPIYQAIARTKQRIELIRADSHNLSTFKNVQNLLKGKKLDFVFIDGDHSYEGVKADFHLYSQLVGKNSYIAFHDIVPGPTKYVGGVPQFWAEIKAKYKYIEFVKDWTQNGFGIGIVIFD